MLYLPKNVERLVSVASKDDGTRYALGGVRCFDYDTHYCLMATDGRRMGCVQGVNDGPDEMFGPDLLAKPDTLKEYCVPAKDWTAGFRQPHSDRWRKDDRAKFLLLSDCAEGKANITFASSAGSMRMEGLEGRCPPFRDIVPKSAPLATCKVNAKYLADVLLLAAQYADGETLTTTLAFYGEKGYLWVSTKNSQGQIFDGCVVPLT